MVKRLRKSVQYILRYSTKYARVSAVSYRTFLNELCYHWSYPADVHQIFARYSHIINLPPWLSGLAISGLGAVKAWLAIRQGVGSYPTPAGMSSQVSA